MSPPSTDEPSRDLESVRLARTIQRIAASHTEESLLHAICLGARDVVSAQGASVILADGDMVQYVEENAIGALWKAQRFPQEACISGQSIRDRHLIAIPDIYDDSRVPLDYYRPTFVRSMAMLPLNGFDPGGALGVYWSSPHTLTTHEQVLLQTVTTAAEVGLNNALLHKQVNVAREEAQRAARQKDHAIALIAHELRDPTQGIIGWVQRAQECREESQVWSRALAAMARCATAQQRLIDDLLDSTRMSACAVTLDRRELNLAKLIAAVVERANPEAQRRQVALVVEISDTTLFVLGDDLRLQQVLGNVLSNALKFTPPHGTVTVALAPVPDGSEMIVTDTGRGIPAESLPHVFDRFYQVSVDGARHGGLGLGLSIVRSIVAMHGGDVTVSSPGIGAGTTVRIRLPRIAPSSGLLASK